MNVIFNGTATAIITPFTAFGDINYEVLQSLIVEQEQAGVATLVVNGTTSEAATLSYEEQQELIKFVVKNSSEQTKVIAGVSSNDTIKAAEMAKEFSIAGLDGLLVLTPYYNKANDKGMTAHFETILAATHLPIILYHIPGRTGCGISTNVLRILSKNPQVKGIKFADNDYTYAMEILRDYCDENFAFYSGNDDMTFPLLAMGASGSISAAANLLPKQIEDIYQLVMNGDYIAAREKHAQQLKLVQSLFVETNPIPVKYAMKVSGHEVGGYRLPLCDPEESTQQLIKELMRECGLYA